MKSFKVLVVILIALFTVISCQKAEKEPAAAETIALFNGENLDGWYSFLREKGLNNDPEGIFTVEDGMIRILGKEFGYLGTTSEYENYKLVVEFKWGDEKFLEGELSQNSGIIYHFPADSTDRTWPYAIECQLKTQNIGDLILMGTSMVVNGVQGNPQNRKFAKSENAENPIGEWNTIEIIAKDNTITHIVNGKTLNQGTQTSVNKGKILLQSEGAELFVRKVTLTPLH